MITVRRIVIAVVLVGVWCALWGEVSAANLVSGAAVAVAVLALDIGTPGVGSVRLGPLLHFAGLVALDLVVSTAVVAREVLTRTDYTAEAIVAVPVPTSARAHLLLLVVAVTVTPGTAVVDTDPDTGTLYLHLLHAERREPVVAHVQQLAELACRALPTGPEPTESIR